MFMAIMAVVSLVAAAGSAAIGAYAAWKQSEEDLEDIAYEDSYLEEQAEIMTTQAEEKLDIEAWEAQRERELAMQAIEIKERDLERFSLRRESVVTETTETVRQMEREHGQVRGEETVRLGASGLLIAGSLISVLEDITNEYQQRISTTQEAGRREVADIDIQSEQLEAGLALEAERAGFTYTSQIRRAEYDYEGAMGQAGLIDLRREHLVTQRERIEENRWMIPTGAALSFLGQAAGDAAFYAARK